MTGSIASMRGDEAQHAYQFSLAPIHWWATEDGWLDRTLGPDRPELFRLVRDAGFPAVKAEIPQDMSVASFKQLLDDAGLAPAPDYFVIRLPEQGTLEATLEQMRQSAGRQARLGMSDMFIGFGMSKEAVRVRRPAIGAESDAARLNYLIDVVGKAAEAMQTEGVSAALHPHIGTWVETEAETRKILDSIDGALLKFGPDTGHLGWAGADLVPLVKHYADRITALHIKDIKDSVRQQSLASGWTYQETVKAGIWMEPGLGDLDLKGVLAALGPDFNGWLVGEVDRATMPPFESAKVTARWFHELVRPAPTSAQN